MAIGGVGCIIGQSGNVKNCAVIITIKRCSICCGSSVKCTATVSRRTAICRIDDANQDVGAVVIELVVQDEGGPAAFGRKLKWTFIHLVCLTEGYQVGIAAENALVRINHIHLDSFHGIGGIGIASIVKSNGSKGSCTALGSNNLIGSVNLLGE